jgi:hypothetical protein
MVDPNIIAQWRRAPRLNDFAAFFDETASGLANQPDLGVPVADPALLGFDLQCLIFADSHRRLWGHFDNHYFASIPFRLEEECRLGAALLLFGLKAWARRGAAAIYTLGAGAGTLSRALAKLGDGRIDTLSCSPSEANRASFFAGNPLPHARFHLGPFFDLDDERYASDDNLAAFRNGFDVLLEDTTFQMYGSDRAAQLSFVAPRVRSDGLLIQVQKINQPDGASYKRRERQKDDQFKSRFFSEAQILGKRRDILDTMDRCQVDLAQSIAALAQHFTYSVVTWNSGNFYTIVSSNSARALQAFIKSLTAPAIPSAFRYETLPQGYDRGERFALTSRWSWRRCDPMPPSKEGERDPEIQAVLPEAW